MRSNHAWSLEHSRGRTSWSQEDQHSWAAGKGSSSYDIPERTARVKGFYNMTSPDARLAEGLVLITAFLCLTEATLVGSSTHDFTVRTDPIMRRLGKTRTPWARRVMLPLGAHLSNGTAGFFLGAGGGSRTHFSHHSGCLLRVATRRVCSPSPEPIGLRWTSQPRPRIAPGEDDQPAANRISLMK